MKRIAVPIILLGVGLITGLLLVVTPTSAQVTNGGILTTEHIERIKTNCVQAQTTLNQLQKSDALLRVNQGQMYENISTKLMAPFNSRAGLNQYNITALTQITGEFNDHLDDFRDLYQDYNDTLKQVIDVDCRNQPVAFYEGVASAREKRSNVYQKALDLIDDVKEYQTAFELLLEEGR